MEILKPKSFNYIIEGFEKEIDEDLNKLFHATILALREEDSSIAKSFSQAPRIFSDFYSDFNKGLALELFETTLVYTIFKSWMPLVPVLWEENYPGDLNDRADLVLYNHSANKINFIVEAKWWQNNQEDTISKLKKDIIKMMKWKGKHDRLLITFWYSHFDSWEKDRAEVKVFSDLPDINIKEIYFAAFPTDLEKINKNNYGGYFAMSVFNVNNL